MSGVVMLAVGSLLVGCEAPRRLVSFPPGTLPVRYEPATSHSECLVAGVAMAANYLENSQRFTAEKMSAEMRAAGADETRVADVKAYLAERGLHLIVLAGRLDNEPPTGLDFWVRQQRYPAVCVINRWGTDPDFNHAVVVIGMSGNPAVETADTIHYLDPSAESPLFTCSTGDFEALWARCGHAMLIVTRPPAEPADVEMDGIVGDDLSPR